MKYKRITVNTATTGGEKAEECMELAILIGGKIYKVSERHNQLHIRVDGELNIVPIANNCISIEENK